jgi:hypothetical protein
MGKVIVIASGAKQSISPRGQNGLLRRWLLAMTAKSAIEPEIIMLWYVNERQVGRSIK